jgi:hypothetical protein
MGFTTFFWGAAFSSARRGGLLHRELARNGFFC